MSQSREAPFQLSASRDGWHLFCGPRPQRGWQKQTASYNATQNATGPADHDTSIRVQNRPPPSAQPTTPIDNKSNTSPRSLRVITSYSSLFLLSLCASFRSPFTITCSKLELERIYLVGIIFILDARNLERRVEIWWKRDRFWQRFERKKESRERRKRECLLCLLGR